MSERELITAVICQAAEDVFYNVKRLKNKKRRDYERYYKRDALMWFKSKSHKYGSFIWYCGLIDLDPEYILRKIKKA